VEVAGVIRVERLVIQAFEEAGDGALAMLGQEFVQRLRGKVTEGRVVHLGARGADDLQLVGDQTVGVQRAERGQQHPLRQVAGGAEQQQAVCGKAHA
jgi:hypothetical protein